MKEKRDVEKMEVLGGEKELRRLGKRDRKGREEGKRERKK